MATELLPSPREVYVFTDGACSGNPGPGGWGAIFVFHESKSAQYLVREIGGHESATTNNRMELLSILRAMEFLRDAGRELMGERDRVVIFSDSSYALKGLEEWLPGWKRKNWKTLDGGEVKNQDLWKLLDDRLAQWRASVEMPRLEFKKVKGHAGNLGNERVDQLAVSWSRWRDDEPLPRDASGVLPAEWLKPRVDPAQAESALAAKYPTVFSQKTPYYLSLVQGKLQHFMTWKECEAHVKGRGNAKYQKISSRDQLLDALVKWGLS